LPSSASSQIVGVVVSGVATLTRRERASNHFVDNIVNQVMTIPHVPIRRHRLLLCDGNLGEWWIVDNVIPSQWKPGRGATSRNGEAPVVPDA
jgi:hypothetical protein